MITFIPTPIGNLEDITLRSLNRLFEAEILLCEDTRVAKKIIKLLSEKHNKNHKIVDYISFHSHNEDERLKSFNVEYFNKNIVFISDAGMPCISDPGAKLVRYLQQNSIEYDFLPGANAATLAYGMSGFMEDDFYFYGFLPHKNNRLLDLRAIVFGNINTIIYESPHRIEQLLDEIIAIDGEIEIFVAKELTKMYQFTLRDKAKEIKSKIKSFKGEWVVIIKPVAIEQKVLTHSQILEFDIPPKIKAKLLAKIDGVAVKEWYNKLI